MNEALRRCRGQKRKKQDGNWSWRDWSRDRAPESSWPLILIYHCFGFVSSAQVNPFVLLDYPLITFNSQFQWKPWSALTHNEWATAASAVGNHFLQTDPSILHLMLSGGRYTKLQPCMWTSVSLVLQLHARALNNYSGYSYWHDLQVLVQIDDDPTRHTIPQTSRIHLHDTQTKG